MNEDTLLCANTGDILFFHDREGFRNSRPENIGFHVQLPDYVVIDKLDLKFNYEFDDFENYGHTCSIMGIKRKKPGITDEEFRSFFNKVGTINNQGYDREFVEEDPHVFSTLYAAGDHDDEGFLNDLMRTMKNYDPHRPENIENVTRILEARRTTGKLLPTDMANVALHMISALYKAARVGSIGVKKGKTRQAYRLVNDLLLEAASLANSRAEYALAPPVKKKKPKQLNPGLRRGIKPVDVVDVSVKDRPIDLSKTFMPSVAMGKPFR